MYFFVFLVFVLYVHSSSSSLSPMSSTWSSAHRPTYCSLTAFSSGELALRFAKYTLLFFRLRICVRPSCWKLFQRASAGGTSAATVSATADFLVFVLVATAAATGAGAEAVGDGALSPHAKRPAADAHSAPSTLTHQPAPAAAAIVRVAAAAAAS